VSGARADSRLGGRLPNRLRPPLRAAAEQWRNWIRYRGRNFIRGTRISWFPAREVLGQARGGNAAADVRAGLNVGLLAFPQGVAYSLIAGLPPQCGLVSCSVGAVTGALFTRSRFVVHGATNATAILLFSGMVAAGLPEDRRLAALPLFIVLVGAFQILAALFRASQVLGYISRTVLTGYVTAAAILIMAGQLQNILGVRVPNASTLLSVLSGTLGQIRGAQWPEMLMAASAWACHTLLQRWRPRYPNVALTLLAMALLARLFELQGIPLAYLAGFSLDHLNLLGVTPTLEMMGQLAPAALALAFVAVLEGTSVGLTLASRAGERLDKSQEIYGMGVANLGSAICGGMDASGSLTRSALNAASGARTPMANIYGGLVVLALVLSVGFLIHFIPRAALAVMVISIGLSLINRHHIVTALRTTRSDAAVFLVTCIGGLLFKLDTCIYLGALTSVVLFLRKAGVPELAEYAFNSSGQLAEVSRSEQRTNPAVSILHAEGDLFFGSTDLFVQQAREVTRDPLLKAIVLRLKNARNLDATCLLAIEELHDFLRTQGRHLLVSGADLDVRRVFRRSGFLAKLGEENFFPEVPGNPTVATRDALKRAQVLLGQRKVDVRIFVDAGKAPARPDPGT
jgi:sulfate permease, SulP family